MNDKIWTMSNVLSTLRIVLVLPIILCILSDERACAVGLIGIAVLTDFFDGLIARRLHQVTDLGKIIDPIADKIAVGIVCVALAVRGELPVWFLFLILARDILIFAGGVYMKKTKKILLQSNTTGKWAVTVVALYILMTVLDFNAIQWAKTSLLFASTIMLLLSFVLYLRRFMGMLSSRQNETRV